MIKVKILRCATLASLIFLFYKSMLLAQITVNINSGNPAFPFPQFLAYENPTQELGNLATNNPVGVCHAEMEKSIREAYQIMMNRANKTGTALSGVDYIKFTSTPDCSEGDGYALLAAAAMADKTTFDGLWLWVHDNALNKDTSYSTGQPSAPYIYGSLVGIWNVAGGNSATDGDEDMTLALYTAYMQWGEFMGISDSRGNPISYKNDLVQLLKGMTDTIPFSLNPTAYICGDIGMDGYIKGGDSWTELTNWASNTVQSGFLKPPNFAGPQTEYVDYAAPSYFHEFANFLSQENPSLYAWNISQFQRCEASSDWLIDQLLANSQNIPFAGQVSLSSSNQANFTQISLGEDFRLAWRTILNSVWHGDPATTWDPVAHQVIAATPNTFERDIGQRYGKFLWDTRQAPWNNSCVTVANSTYKYWGPSVILDSYLITGAPAGTFFFNWVPGTGSPSAVVSQDFNLMAELYRTCEIEWDAEVIGDGYLTSVPRYFHEWFRLFGMLLLSGNYSAPSIIKPIANMKVYLDVDKTCAMKGDTISYTISYRNYGSLDAQNVVVTDTIPNDLSFLSCTGGGTYQSSSRIVSWTIGTVPGFKTASGIAPTTGEVSLKVSLAAISQKQYANKVSISCENGSGWTSNEYPNKVSSVLKRNFVDVINKPITGGDSVATVNT
ncbi:MAG: glycosyl hydrolase family 8, partial [Chitinivibrionales bacterium]